MPSAPPISVVESNSSCMPMQSPITGTAASTRSRRSWSSLRSRTRSIAFGIAPTPGSTIPSASRTRACSLVRNGSAPTCSSALPTERRFPIP